MILRSFPQDLKESWADIQKILKSNLSHAQSSGATVQAPQSAAPLLDVSSHTKMKPKLVDRSHNVIVFGVPESKTLLNTESLVSPAFEFVAGRKIESADCRRIGKYLQGASKGLTITC